MSSHGWPRRIDRDYRLSVSSSNDIRAASYGMIETDQLLDYAGQRFQPRGLFSERIFGAVTSWRCECGKYQLNHATDEPLQEETPTVLVCEVCHVRLDNNSIRRHRWGHIELATPILHPWMWGTSRRPVELLLGLSTRELRHILHGTRYVTLHEKWHRELQLAAVIPAASAALEEETFPRWQAGFAALCHLLVSIDLTGLADHLTYELAALGSSNVTTPVGRKISSRLALVRELISGHTKPADFVMKVLPVLPAGLRRICVTRGGNVRPCVLTRRYQDIVRCNFSIEPYTENEEILIPFRRRLTGLVRRLFRFLPGGFPYSLDDRVEIPPRANEGGPPVVPRLRSLGRAVKSHTFPQRRKKPRQREQMLAPVRPLWRSKRVDYSAVSVVVPDASLKPNECGLPFDPIAWELFRPLVARSLMLREKISHEYAQAFVACRGEIAVAHLQELMRKTPVVLSLAGARPSSRVKAFTSRPVNDRAIHLHPTTLQQVGLTATGSVAKVFLPLSIYASNEAARMRNAAVNEDTLADRPFTLWPSDEGLLGCFLATSIEPGLLEAEYSPAEHRTWRPFGTIEEVDLAVSAGKLGWTTPIVFRLPGHRTVWGPNNNDAPPSHTSLPHRILTTAGRVLFDAMLQDPAQAKFDLPYFNLSVTRKDFCRLRDMLLDSGQRLRLQTIVARLNAWGLARLTQSGISLSMADLSVPPTKAKHIEESWKGTAKTKKLYERGLISPSECQNKISEIWSHASERVMGDIMQSLAGPSERNTLPASVMDLYKGVMGRTPTLRSLVGLPGNIASPNRRLFSSPVISSLSEGLTMLEYFMHLPSQRHSKLAKRQELREARALVRRLGPLLCNLRITATDCQTNDSMNVEPINNPWGWGRLRDLASALVGRTSASTVMNPISDEALVNAGETMTREHARRIEQQGLTTLNVRSPLTCTEVRGVCATCFGRHPQDSSPSQPGSAVGSQALLALADQLFDVGAVRVFFISRPELDEKGESFARHKGTVSLANLDVVRTASGRSIVVSRAGTIDIFDWKARQVQSELLPHGAELEVNNGAHVSPGTLLARWKPDSAKIYARADATIVLANLIPGKNAKEEQLASGESLWKVTAVGPASPLMLLISPAGIKLEYFYLPENTWLRVRNGETVAAGTLLAETWPVRTREYQYESRGLQGVIDALVTETSQPRAILAECSGRVEVSTLDVQGRCNVLIHEINANGRATKDVIPHAIPPFHRLSVSTGSVVQSGDALTPGHRSLHDLLRLRGKKETSHFMLVRVLYPLLLQRSKNVDERLWELVLSRMFAHVEITSPGVYGELVGKLVEGNMLRQTNERLRQCVEITDVGDACDLTAGDIISKAAFEANCEKTRIAGGQIPQAEKPWLAGFRQRLLGIKWASNNGGNALLSIDRNALRENLVRSAIAGASVSDNSVQYAILTGKLIPAGSAWLWRPNEVSR